MSRSLTLGASAASFEPLPSNAPYSNLVKALYNYALKELRAGRPFYISDELNSEVLRLPEGMGFFVIDDIIAAAATVAAVVKPVAEIAAVANTVKGLSPQKSSGGVTADQIATAILPNVQAQLATKGVQLPSQAANSLISASILDSFGAQYHNLVLFAGLGLGAILLFKLVRG